MSRLVPCMMGSSPTYTGRKTASSAAMAQLAPRISSSPCRKDLPVATQSWVNTGTAAAITTPMCHGRKKTWWMSGLSSSQQALAASDPASVRTMMVVLSLPLSQSRPARKNGAALGRPQPTSTPISPGSTRSSVSSPSSLGPPARATSTVAADSDASATTRAATLAVRTAGTRAVTRPEIRFSRPPRPGWPGGRRLSGIRMAGSCRVG